MVTYKDAGVDVEAADKLVKEIKGIARKTHSPDVLSAIGGFNGMMALPTGYSEPVLVSSTDGVGTKLRLAIDYDRYDGIGIDLVAMCVNDLITSGAKPLFFLDYYATGMLDNHTASQVISSIADGCVESNMTLLGGETAEMPSMYNESDFDLAGFAVGVVEKNNILSPDYIDSGDVVIGFESNGVHSNGFSLIHKIFEGRGFEPKFVNEFLKPTRLYTGTMNRVGKYATVAAHITGGGLLANVRRVIPDYLDVEIDMYSWISPDYVNMIMGEGDVSIETMKTTFNCGIGFVIITPPRYVDSIMRNTDCKAWVIGEVKDKAEI